MSDGIDVHLVSLGDGFEVELVTALAEDGGGDRLRELLRDAGVRVCAVPLAGGTPEKIRMRAHGRRSRVHHQVDRLRRL